MRAGIGKGEIEVPKAIDFQISRPETATGKIQTNELRQVACCMHG